MRVQQRFAWSQSLAAIVWLALSYAWGSKPHAVPGIRSAYIVIGGMWFVVLLISLLSHFLIWWDLTESGLTEHRLLSTRTVPWAELTRVGPWVPGKKPIRTIVEVAYHRSAPMSDSGRLLLQPKEGQRKTLFAQLYHYAPQATFDSC